MVVLDNDCLDTDRDTDSDCLNLCLVHCLRKKCERCALNKGVRLEPRSGNREPQTVIVQGTQTGQTVIVWVLFWKILWLKP